METFSALLAFCAGNSRSPVNFPHKGQWRGVLVFSLICVWINCWVKNPEAGDFRRLRAHYDVIVMLCMFPKVYCRLRSHGWSLRSMTILQFAMCLLHRRQHNALSVSQAINLNKDMHAHRFSCIKRQNLNRILTTVLFLYRESCIPE